ncbi:MAG: 50S ribosomal protein L3 [Euryarchaeota archaeon]|nr:50S ribosomal protein L3 [Euryarchaeota archaeon]
MGSAHTPKRGSRGYWHRSRARSETPRIKAWPETDGAEPYLQGFAGYKVGMTHAHIKDYRPTSTTSGQDVLMPVTIVETPAMKVAGVRAYKRTPYGLETLTEVWADKLDRFLAKRLPLPTKQDAESKWKLMDDEPLLEDVRVLAYTQPNKVTGVPKKIPEVMEIRVGGGDLKARIEYAKGLLGKEVEASDVIKAGSMQDVIGVTTGHGFTGHVKRFGVKLLTHKNSKHRRMIGTQGSWHPAWVQATVPNAGQHGYHQRTDYNKRVLKLGENGEEINPAGGFPHYGLVRNRYIMFHGSLPGPQKRLLRFREAIRYHRGVTIEAPEIEYVSTQSKQGV